MELTIEQIAQVCHAANREYCVHAGDSDRPSWLNTADRIRESVIEGVLFFSDNPLANPIDMHANWMRSKKADGWVYGPNIDMHRKQHPCMAPYEELSEEHKRKDSLFIGIVKALS